MVYAEDIIQETIKLVPDLVFVPCREPVMTPDGYCTCLFTIHVDRDGQLRDHDIWIGIDAEGLFLGDDWECDRRIKGVAIPASIQEVLEEEFKGKGLK